MSSPLQQFFLDLKTFAGDLRDLLSGRYLRQALAGSWQELRQDRMLQLPLIFTVAVHLGALLLSLAGPLLLSGKVRIPEVYRVELYTAAEVPPAPAPPVAEPVAPPVPAAQPVPAPTIKAQVKTPPAPVQVSIAKPKAVSLSPIKQRLLKEEKVRQDRERQERQARLLDLRMEELKLARQQKEAEEAAQVAASRAVDRIADFYRTTPATTPTATTVQQNAAVAPAQSGGSGEPSPRQLEALERYKSRLFQHIKPNWQLPDLQNWDESLEARIVLKMNWDGSVDNTWFEKRSGDYRFDQYVKKAIDNSIPLPPLPLEFDRKSEEIAVTFTPGGLM
jgi:outer membrane biosynthesis protein TonB